MRVTFDFIYVFRGKERADTAAKRLSLGGLTVQTVKGDDGEHWQARATLERDWDLSDVRILDDELLECLYRLMDEYGTALNDLAPTEDSGFGYSRDGDDVAHTTA